MVDNAFDNACTSSTTASTMTSLGWPRSARRSATSEPQLTEKNPHLCFRKPPSLHLGRWARQSACESISSWSPAQMLCAPRAPPAPSAPRQGSPGWRSSRETCTPWHARLNIQSVHVPPCRASALARVVQRCSPGAVSVRSARVQYIQMQCRCILA